ncbi:MAG: hypothetical protein GF353_20725 [Candidatus Lokiarchaeota archaeon]|nr:hypothetical protein [Candidatus Lokiarchaeota archaeon]
MTTFLTIFNLFSGTASIVGFAYVFTKKNKERFIKICKIAFVITTILSIYVLFVPGNYFKNNVNSKIHYYSLKQANDTLIQEGSFSFSGFGPYAIKFHKPFAEKPEVEIINVNGYSHEPSVSQITEHKVVFKRYSSGPSLIPDSFQKYIWVAKGKPYSKYTNTE